PRSFLVRRR
nr:Chain C, PRO-ARG-SER-PHE-LEU-VAL-ARG-ARG-ARG [Homo sapiens]